MRRAAAHLRGGGAPGAEGGRALAKIASCAARRGAVARRRAPSLHLPTCTTPNPPQGCGRQLARAAAVSTAWRHAAEQVRARHRPPTAT